MGRQLRISAGQYSDRGRKRTNQDFHGLVIPNEPALSAKGIAIALADGISSSEVSQIASESAVSGFLEDYYCTPDAWTVRTSAERVLVATNSWLHAQTQQSQHRFDMDRGYVCTFSALVLKSTTAHVFHVGDTRVYRLRGAALEQLTDDHRVWVSSTQSYLSRALGIDRKLDIDYLTVPVEQGDVFLLATDGVHEHVDGAAMAAIVERCAGDPDPAARAIAEQARERGSPDNLSIQVVRIDELPGPEANEIYRQLSELPFPPLLDARKDFDGYRIVREVHGSSRSHIYLAVDTESQERVIVKTPAIDRQNDPAYLERFLLEEWIARRIDNAHVLKPCSQTRKRNFIYVVTEFIEGHTLAQWMRDNPRPDLAIVRDFIEQIAKGLQAFHRLEMVHQDLKPDNVMIDVTGTLKIIDFGATRVAGIMEVPTPIDQINLLGAAQYAAPEYFLGEPGSARSDLFSLGVIAYQMLSGKLPYGADVPRSRTRAAQKKLAYRSLAAADREIPAWVDEAIRKAVHPDPKARYAELSEFVFDLRHPNQALLGRAREPLVERNPLMFWKLVSLILLAAVIALGWQLAAH
ncbi:MAG: bifunctional protein-serine/threonine kinase/phosphatase [Pseudomonadales bacterium]|nr:bifunctional protein-serine/threonine kinase/phosphatase [Pseudomonadales bacterium]MBP9033316.1 bifunctional protein-serine/threonine kinase/phosphatase [Pseudomonadales bacterium]